MTRDESENYVKKDHRRYVIRHSERAAFVWTYYDDSTNKVEHVKIDCHNGIVRC